MLLSKKGFSNRKFQIEKDRLRVVQVGKLDVFQELIWNSGNLVRLPLSNPGA